MSSPCLGFLRASLAAVAGLLFNAPVLGQVAVGGSLSDDTTGPLLSGVVYHASSSLLVPAGKTLTVQSGAIVKLQAGEWFLAAGTLAVQGTPASPAILTDLRDDTAGGDTNGDGAATSPAPGAWSGLHFYSSSAGNSVEQLEVRYPGYNFAAGIGFEAGATGVLEGTKVKYGYWIGVDLQGNNLGVSVRDCSFEGNGGTAVANVPIDAVPNFLNNHASGNGGNYLLVTAGTVGSTPLVIQSSHVLGGALVLPNGVSVPVGSQLTLGPGVVLKMGSASFLAVRGRLLVTGTSARHAVITELRDDTAGGDTNGDGAASLPQKGTWSGVTFFSTSSGNDLSWLEVRYPGYNFAAGMVLEAGARGVMGHSTIRDAYASALDLQGAHAGMGIHDCRFLDNGGIAVANSPLDAVPSFLDNQAEGNGGNYMQISNGTVGTSPLVIEAGNVLGGALVAPNGILVPNGRSLTLDPGVVIKLSSGGWILVRGTLRVLGGELNPVVLTEFRDDTIGGDTNNDGGASQPAKGAWSGLYYTWDAAACSARNLTVRYGGYNLVTSLYTELAADAAFEHVRVERAYSGGIGLNSHTGEARRLVAWDCGGIGIDLLGGSFELRQVSSVANGTGIRASGWTGNAHDTIAWANGMNFAGSFFAGNLAYSDGDPLLAGTNGNLNTAPQFVGEASGDFHLFETSPCIDSGNPLSPADPDATRADMGAYPFDHCAPALYCQGKPNSQGCAPRLDWSGRASLSDPNPFLLSAHQVINNKPGLFLYSQGGPASLPFQGGTLCVASPIKRSEPLYSGGNPPPNDCSGLFVYDFNARIRSGVDPQLVAGAQVWAQCWSRDPQGRFGSSLSNAIRFGICP